MAGKNGSEWHHGWIPVNAAAMKLKAHQKPSAANSFLPVPASFRAPKGTGPAGKAGRDLARARTARTVKIAAPKKTAAKPKMAKIKPARPAKAAAPRSTEEHVLDVARSLQKQTGKSYATISDIREQMHRDGVSQTAVDGALKNLYTKSRKVNLTSNANKRALTPRQNAGGFRIGGDVKHQLRIN